MAMRKDAGGWRRLVECRAKNGPGLGAPESGASHLDPEEADATRHDCSRRCN